MIPEYSTACLDWHERIVEGDSLIPFSPLYPDEAAAAIEIFKGLRIVDVLDEPTFGEIGKEWIFEWVACIFGAYCPERKRRLIQRFWLQIPKKNTKSTLAAGVMLTAIILNARKSAEFIILAPTKEVADNSFTPARDMIYADAALQAIFHVKEIERTIIHRTTRATLKVVAADSETVSGKKATGVLFDEVWLFGKKSNAAKMFREAVGGLKSRPEGFVIYLTTQSDDPPAGVYAALLKEFRDIRDGKIEDNKSFGVTFEYPPEMIKAKAYLNPETFHIPNPNLGASVHLEDLISEFERAQREGAAELADFLAKNLNVEITGGLRSDGWSGAEHWDRGTDASLRDLAVLIERSEVIDVSMDGGGLDDLLGLAVLGREAGTDVWLNWNKAFIGPEGIKRRKANITKYEDFQKDGDLVIVDKLPLDVDGVIDIVTTIKESGKLHCVGLDPAGLGILVDELARIDLTQENGMVTGVKQGVALMGAIKTVERKIVDGTFKHGGTRLMAWCAGNAIVSVMSTGIRVARDESGFGKIDPLMATMNCASLMAMNPESKLSVYEERGLRFA